MHDYEAIRQKNLEDNKKILASFGLLDPFKSLPSIIKTRKVFKSAVTLKKRPATTSPESFIGGSIFGQSRKSARIQGKDADDVSLQTDEDLEEEIIKVQPKKDNFYGAIPDIEVGTVWETRLECSRAGVHRSTVAGIHSGKEGAFAIALSGGYEDDIDLGECFTYTGSGGRDLKGTKSKPKNLRTAPQSKDQTLTNGNLALSKNVLTRNPVRVIRGYKLNSPFAPESGYRYDGLYSVEKSWFTTGLSGYGVWKFALKRCDNQAPPPWHFAQEPDSAGDISHSPEAECKKKRHSLTENDE